MPPKRSTDSIVDLGANQIHSGIIRYYFNSEQPLNAGAYSLGHSEDGQNWKRFGDCSCGPGCGGAGKPGCDVRCGSGGALGPLGVLTPSPGHWDVPAPNTPFQYLDFSTACWNTHIREVQWLPSIPGARSANRENDARFDVHWGCLGETYQLDSTTIAENPKMIDGNVVEDATKTCNGHSVIDLGMNQKYSGVFRYYFNSQPHYQAGSYSLGLSEDGQNWKRFGECACGPGCGGAGKPGCDVRCGSGGALGPLGVLTQPPGHWDVPAPNATFQYLDFSTACSNTHIREVQWLPSSG